MIFTTQLTRYTNNINSSPCFSVNFRAKMIMIITILAVVLPLDGKSKMLLRDSIRFYS